MISAKYVKLPIDPNSVKQKVILGLTKRQIISFLIGGACGIIPFFITKEIAGLVPAVFALCIFAAPAVICGLYERNGIAFDVHIKLMWKFMRTPKQCVYTAHNAAEYAEFISEKQELNRTLRKGFRNVKNNGNRLNKRRKESDKSADSGD